MRRQLSELPIRLFPKDGEGVRGYLQRLANDNGLINLNQFGKAKHLSLEDMNYLLGRDDSKFWRNHPAAIYWEDVSSVKKIQWNWASRRCCPKCLHGEMVWPTEWELRGLGVCLHHAVRLIDTCPFCQKRLSWKTDQLTHCECGFDLRNAQTEACSEQESDLAKAIVATIGVGSCPPSMAHLEGIQTAALFRVLYFLGKFAGGESSVKVSGTATLKELEPVYKEAAMALSDWPTNFHMWMERLKGDEGLAEKSMAIPEVFGKAYGYLYRNMHEKPYNFIRREFESHMVNHWSWPLNNRNKRIPQELREDSSWITTSKAAELLDTGKSQVMHLIEQGYIEGRTIDRKGRLFVAVNRNDLSRARKRLAEVVNLKEACEILGVSESRLLELNEGELVNPIATSSETSSGQWQFEVAMLILINKYASETPILKDTNENHVLMKGLLKSGLRGDGAFARLMKAVFECRLKVIARLHGCVGVSGWILDRSSYETWVRNILESEARGYTVREASRILGVKEEVGYALVNEGVIKADIMKLHGRKLAYILLEQLDEFKAQYILGTELANEYGTSPRKIVEIMADKGVFPIAGPGISRCRQVIFERRLCEGVRNRMWPD